MAGAALFGIFSVTLVWFLVWLWLRSRYPDARRELHRVLDFLVDLERDAYAHQKTEPYAVNVAGRIRTFNRTVERPPR